MKDYLFFIISFVIIIVVWMITLTYIVGNINTTHYEEKIDSLETVVNNIKKSKKDTIYVVIRNENK